VNQDVDSWHVRAQLVHVVLAEAAVHGAVALPQDHAGRGEGFWRVSAQGLARVPHHAVVEAEAQGQHRGVAAQVLVGHEQHLAVAVDPTHLVEGPSHRNLGIGGRTHGAVVAAAEGLDGRR